MTEQVDRKRRRGRKGDVGGSSTGGNGAGPSMKKPKKNLTTNSNSPHEDSVENYQAHKTPLIHPFDDEIRTWYDYGQNLPGRNDTILTDPPRPTDQSNRNFISKCRSIGDLIFQCEMQLIGKGSSSNSTADERWVETTMRKGTLKDRIAAMSVSASSDPIHKLYALDGLLSMVGCSETGGKANSRVAQLTAEALDDLFLNTLLPPHRKLLSLSQRPLYRYEADKNGKKSKTTLSPRILLLWRFEEMVKEKYELYLRKYMSQTLQEGVEMQKISILQSAGSLLSTVPEGENLLLSMMVNKLGDPGKKTASAAGHHLRLVLQKHPNMQLIVAREVQQLAHRPHLSPGALYNCIVFLNQLKLTREEDDNDNDSEQNIYKKFQQEPLPASLIKTYFRLFEVAVKNKKEKHEEKSDGAHMKSRLLSALLTGVNRAHPYLPAKSKDMEEHVDALYRVVHTAAPTACTQALMLLFHLAVGTKDSDDDDDNLPAEQTKVTETESVAGNTRKDRFYRALYATLSKPTLVSQGKHLTMYFNLLYKAMKFDTDSNRVNAFAKRLMCTVLHCNSPPIAGSIFLLNEIAKTHEGLRICTQDPPTESDAMVYLDETKRDPRSALSIMKPGSSAGDDVDTSKEEISSNTAYYPASWELSLLAHHFHPSVSRFAGTIGAIDYAGDPLKDFGLAPFLDKFAYRNPKSKDKLVSHLKRGESIAERRSGMDDLLRSRLQVPMNDPAFLQAENVNEQDEFFQRFFTERARRDEIKGIVRGGKNTALDEEEMEDAEDGAMDAAEEAEGLDTGKSFEEYERTWESDSEEEAFVDSLALKLLEDSADGPADIDDDPDVDDWGDLHSDNEEEHSDDVSDVEPEFVKDDVSKESDDGDDDDVDDDDDDDGSENIQDEDDFMDADDSDESDDGNELTTESFPQDDDDDEEGDGLLLDDEDSDSSDDDDDDKASSRNKKKKMSTLPTFADADDYAHLMESYTSTSNKTSKGKSPTPTPQETADTKRKKKNCKKRK